jgi:hypothetical protein
MEMIKVWLFYAMAAVAAFLGLAFAQNSSKPIILPPISRT